MLAIAINFFSLAGFLFFSSESWTMHTGYSTESSWHISIPGATGFSISASVGIAVLILLLLGGTLFLWLANVAYWRSRHNVAVDQAGNG